MANTNAPMGFIPKYNATGAPLASNNFATYTIASAYSTSIFTGDPVKSTGTGTLGRSGIQICAAGDTVRGIFAGVSYTDATGAFIYSKYWPASTVATNIIAYVYDNPSIVFEVQNDSVAATPAVTDVSNKADYVAGTGSTLTGQSAFQIDTSDISTGDGLLILEFVQRADNIVGAYAKVHVLLREHELRSTLTAV